MHISPNVSVLTWDVCLSVACANDCLINADFGDCDPLDDSCLCHNQAFVSSVTVCIQRACSGDELASAESAAQQATEDSEDIVMETPEDSTPEPLQQNDSQSDREDQEIILDTQEDPAENVSSTKEPEEVTA